MSHQQKPYVHSLPTAHFTYEKEAISCMTHNQILIIIYRIKSENALKKYKTYLSDLTS